MYNVVFLLWMLIVVLKREWSSSRQASERARGSRFAVRVWFCTFHPVSVEWRGVLTVVPDGTFRFAVRFRIAHSIRIRFP